MNRDSGARILDGTIPAQIGSAVSGALGELAPGAHSGAIIYQGPSLLDRSPIVVVATGLSRVSANAKTGAMIQTYILRADVHPVPAAHAGEDAAICGDCPLRPINAARSGGPACYVNKGFGPAAVYRNLDRYPILDPRAVSALALQLGRPIRLGTYGDPAAVPVSVWRDLVAVQTSFTGYTHQWRRLSALGLQPYCMASVSSSAEAAIAQRAGWRTYRVRAGSDSLNQSEIVCPASLEAGHRVSCAQCLLCAGQTRSGARSIAIIDHGPTAVRRNA